MDAQQLHQLLDKGNNPNSSDISSLKAMVEEYPYFQAGIFTYLKALYLYKYEGFEGELEHLSIFVNNRKALFYYILSDEYNRFFEKTGKNNVDEDKTNILLNAFFETRDDAINNVEFEYNLTNSGLASLDYFTYLNVASSNTKEETPQTPEDTIPLKHQGIIDSFIEKSQEEGGIRILINNDNENLASNLSVIEENTDDEELNEDMFFTETLAKIYIKQKKYEKAYKIIKHLSLNYPKKNIYFADQLSFLDKLIINSKFKDKK